MFGRGEILYRSADGIVAGICGCFAQRWGVDVGVLRFAVIALTLTTCGAFALVYVALWLILPTQEQARRIMDVKPDSVASDTYGFRDLRTEKQEKARVDYAHVPPQSPEEAVAAVRAKTAQSASAAQGTPIVPILLGVGIGIVLVVAGMAFLLSSIAPAFSPIQFWPFAIVAAGIVVMVIPQSKGYRLKNFIVGFVVFCVGVVLTLATTGMYFVHPLEWIIQGWPLLAMALGFLLLWRGTSLNGFAVCMLVLVAAFCAVGIIFCSDAGPAVSLIVQQPFTKGLPLPGVG